MEVTSLSLTCLLLLNFFLAEFHSDPALLAKPASSKSIRDGKEKYQSKNLGKHTGRGIQGEREKILQKRDQWYQSFSSLHCRKIKKWTQVPKKFFFLKLQWKRVPPTATISCFSVMLAVSEAGKEKFQHKSTASVGRSERGRSGCSIRLKAICHH